LIASSVSLAIEEIHCRKTCRLAVLKIL
jgi:hypothetical protein